MTAGLCFCAIAALAAAAEDPAARSERAARAMFEERFAEAETIYQELLRDDPANPGLLLNLGLAQQSLGKLADAAAQFRAVVKLQPEAIPAWLLLGETARKIGRRDEAVAAYEHVVDAEPTNHAAALGLAETLFELGRYEEACSRYFRYVEMEPSSASAWHGLGAGYIHLARRAFQELARTALDSGWWWALAGRERAEAGRLDAAFAFYREALAKDPNLRGVHGAVAEIYGATGHEDWGKAEAALEARLPEPDCTKELPACELRDQRYWQAVEAAAKLSGPRALYWKALGYYELAGIAFTRLAELPISAEVYERTAETHRLLGRHAEAVKAWREALALDPEDRDLQLELARSLVDARDYASARRLLERFAAAQPSSPQINFLFAETLRALGQDERAAAYRERAAGFSFASDEPVLPTRALELERTARIAAP